MAASGAQTVPPGPDIYIEDGKTSKDKQELRLDVTVGNRGTRASRSNFDAFLEVMNGEKTICAKATNFLTPLGPGQSVSTFRFRVAYPAEPSPKRSSYMLYVHIHFWDGQPGCDTDRRNNQIKVPLEWPAGGTAECIVLKPVQ